MKVTSKKDNYIVKCQSREQTISVMNYIQENNCKDWNFWKYIVKCGESLESGFDVLEEYIKEKYSHLPVIKFNDWAKLTEYDPKEVAFKTKPVSELETIKFETKCGQKSYEIDLKNIMNIDEEKPKKLIGYKLVQEEYKEAVKGILKCNPTQDADVLIDLLIQLNSDFHTNIETAGVLHWFKEVYEEIEPTTEEKLFDYLAGEGIGITDEQAKEIINIVNGK